MTASHDPQSFDDMFVHEIFADGREACASYISLSSLLREYQRISRADLIRLQSIDYLSHHDDHPDILIRDGVAVIYLGPVRCILTKQSLKLILPDRCDDRLLDLIDSQLAKGPHSMTERKIPFHLRVYEVILDTVLSSKEVECASFVRTKDDYMKKLERIDLIPITVQEHIKELHVQSEFCASKMRVMQAWLDNLLRNEEEMLELWLEVSSVKEEDAVLYIDIIEMLLDPFLRRINTIISKLEAVNNDVINTRELTRLKLDTIQNSVYFANTYINITLVGASLGVYLTGIYGMNLDIFKEDKPEHYSFVEVSLFLCTFIIGSSICYSLYIHKTRKDINSENFYTEEMYEEFQISSTKIRRTREHKTFVNTMTAESLLSVAVLNEEDLRKVTNSTKTVIRSSRDNVELDQLMDIVFDPDKTLADDEEIENIDMEITVEDFVALLNTKYQSSDNTENVNKDNTDQGLYPSHDMLTTRDLRSYTFQMKFSSHGIGEPSIQCRRGSVMFTLYPVRAIVTSKSIYLVHPSMRAGDDLSNRLKDIKAFIKTMMIRNEEGGMSFPLRAYDSIAHFAFVKHKLSVEDIEKAYDEVFQIVDVDSAGSKGKLAQVTGKIKGLKSRIKNYIDNMAAIIKCFSELTDNEEDCYRLYRNLCGDHSSRDKVGGNASQEGRHGSSRKGCDEIRECLEPYLRDFTTLHTRLVNMQTSLAGMEEGLALRLDVNETKLLLGETYTAIIDTSLAFGCYVTAIFGMNLDQINTYEKVYGLFSGVIIGTTTIIVISGALFAFHCHKRTR